MRSAGPLVAVVLVGTGVIAAAYGAFDALATALILTVLSCLAATAQRLVTRQRHRLGSLRSQFGLIAIVVVGEMLAAVVAAASLMFVSVHDAIIICVLSAGAGALALETARRLSGAVAGDIEVVRDALQDLGDGAGPVVPTIESGANDEVAELADAMTATALRLAEERAAREAAEAARRDLLAAVSHDLRTPLTSLRLLTLALQDFDSSEADRRRDLRQIGTHISALSGLVEDLFELSRLQAGDIAWSLEQVKLDLLLTETVAALDEQGKADAVVLRAEIPDGLPPAHGNPERLQRVLFNLIQNAIRHTPADGSVTVRARATAEALEIEVADTGTGFGASDRERAFEPFYRGPESAARPAGGAGLGLAISRAIVEAHGGRMWIAESRAGAKVRFTVPFFPQTWSGTTG